MQERIKVGAVSYTNTKPLLWGMDGLINAGEMVLSLDYPSRLARQLRAGEIDIALLPVAAIKEIPTAKIISKYGIAADGEVASVCIFSQVPMAEIETLYLDYQSRTSVALAKVLMHDFYEREITYLPAGEDYISNLKGTTAGVIIGDRAMEQLPNFKYVYDLSDAWKQHTGLPFVFAAWVANKPISSKFIAMFEQAQELGLANLDKVVAANPSPHYNLLAYYTKNIHYQLTEEKMEGLNLFLSKLEIPSP